MTPLVVLGIFKNISVTYASIEEIFSQIVYCRDMIKVINAELPNSTNSREIMKQKSKGVKMTPLVVLVLICIIIMIHYKLEVPTKNTDRN